MFTASFLANLAEEFYNKVSKKLINDLDKFINDEEFNNYSPIQKDIILYLEKKIKFIIKANLDEMKVIKDMFKKNKWNAELSTLNKKNKSVQSKFGGEIEKLLNYKDFRSSLTSVWLVKELGIKTCLYCNTQYAFSVGNKITNTFDHFYPKSIYPYLSLSFYNLIPACDYCNRRKNNNQEKLPYPYQENHHEDYKISIDAKSLIDFHNSSMKDETKLKIEVNTYSSDKIKNLNKTININKLYESHTDIVAELIWKAEVYTKEYRKELEDILGVNDLHSEINRFITGNYTDPKDFHKRPLSKLTHDIAEELGLLP